VEKVVELCRVGVLSAALTSRLLSSEWSEFCFFKYGTDSFEIGLFSEKRADVGSSSDRVQFYEKITAEGKRASAQTLQKATVESAEEGSRGNARFQKGD
jgi:hypothetical protein